VLRTPAAEMTLKKDFLYPLYGFMQWECMIDDYHTAAL
jgi:hypothetical protein